MIAIAAINGWQLSGHQRRLRERYDRVRLGMTRAEVASCVGSAPSRGELIIRILGGGDWDSAAHEEQASWSEVDDIDVWVDESLYIGVCYSHGKAVRKVMEISLPPWKVKAREWLARLRGLVGL
jgi:hypothetical protein